jgi:8-oxo-dGTP pyrophosphatase MutT (NUDIX family)
MKKYWEKISSETGFKGKWIDLKLEDVKVPDGNILHYESCYYHREGVGIVAENILKEIILVKSYRFISDFTGWEIPAGTVPPDQHHSDCIIQELREEAGCEVQKEKLDYLGYFYPSIGSSNQKFHCYYTKGVTQSHKHSDTNEVIETGWFIRKEIKKMIANFEIKDGFTIALLSNILLR